MIPAVKEFLLETDPDRGFVRSSSLRDADRCGLIL